MDQLVRLFFLLAFAFQFVSCAPDFKDISSTTGRRAIVERAQGYLTGGNCDSAINILQPITVPPYVDDEIRMVYASAYACKGGFSFTRLLGALIDAGSDIWSIFVKSDYSKDAADGHLEALQTAAELVRNTSPYKDSSDGKHFDAAFRTADANLFMVLLQASILATVISRDTMGKAYPDTGKKSVSISGRGSTSEQCAIQVAVTTIRKSLAYTSGGGGIDKVSTTFTSLCGTSCGENVNPSVCTSTEYTQGAVFAAGIDSQWSTGP